jgi:diguanylate cyclase (GGDEF)-like protein
MSPAEAIVPPEGSSTVVSFLRVLKAGTDVPDTVLPSNSFNTNLDREIEAHKASGLSLAVLCLDLDRFKDVNDLFGHAVGDALLKRVAECVTAALDENQMIARLGGDEFAVIATNIPNPSAVNRIAETIIETLRSNNEPSATGTFVSASIGISIYPNDAEDRRGLLTQADMALYRATADGRCVYRFFEAAMGAEVHQGCSTLCTELHCED